MWLESRDVEIPLTLVQPSQGGGPAPLVVMAHGHGGSRDEGGGFKRLAAMLAEQGIASVRVDFPGCGESREPFTANNINHMMSDLLAARDFALVDAEIDSSRVGLLGFSMGGRLAMLASAESFPYVALALWAPAATDGPADFYDFLGGPSQYSEYRESALDSGSAVITTPWGQQQDLSLAWFTGLEQSKPQQAISSFTNPLLVIHGGSDEIIPPSHSVPISLLASQTQRIVLASAHHGLGFYDDDPVTAERVLQETVRFFIAKMMRR